MTRANLQREQTILSQLERVRQTAAALRHWLPRSLDFDDLVSAGTIGLIEAVDRFDAHHGVKLSTYVRHRIRGSMLDAIRKEVGRGVDRPTVVTGAAAELAIANAAVPRHDYHCLPLDVLPERERRVLYGLFFLGESGEEIGRLLGTGEPRVSQLKQAALRRLRERMAA